jgi:hypothetical protein
MFWFYGSIKFPLFNVLLSFIFYSVVLLREPEIVSSIQKHKIEFMNLRK